MSERRFLYWYDAIVLATDLRLAWTTSVVERVLSLFSPHLRHDFQLQPVLDIVWNFASAFTDDNQEKIFSCEDLVDDEMSNAEEEGYDESFFQMVLQLLREAIDFDGAGSAEAIDYASLAYVSFQCFRQGIDFSDPMISHAYIDTACQPVYQFAFAAYTYALEQKPAAEPKAFSHLVLDTTLIPLPADVLRAATLLPPAVEQTYFQQTYGPYTHRVSPK